MKEQERGKERRIINWINVEKKGKQQTGNKRCKINVETIKMR